MRTPDQVVAEIEKAEKAVQDAADNLKRLQTELSDMYKFVSNNVARFQSKVIPINAAAVDTATDKGLPKHAGEF